MRLITTFILAVAVAVAACATPPEEASEEWSRWRGGDGLGVADGQGLPVTWGPESANIRWKAPLPGGGNSSPVVWGDKVFLTASYRFDPSDAERVMWRVALAVDLGSGELLWETPVYKAPPVEIHRMNTLVAPTPVADGERVYVYFGSHVAALDHVGEILWTQEVEANYGETTHYGASSSPVLTRDAVIVVQDREWARTEDEGWIVALDKKTGEEKWRTTWDNTCCSYSTPLVLDRGSGEEVLYTHSGMVASYSAATGERLWSHPYEINQMVGSPVIDGDVLGISGGAHNVKRTVFLRLSGSGKDTRPELMWDYNRIVPQTSSPVLYEGLFYTVTDRGALVCYRAEDGEMLWRQRLGQAHNRQSLLAGDGRIYVGSSRGSMAVVKAGPQYELLAENSLGELGSNASPAVAGGCLLLRSKRHLYCIEKEAPETA